MSLGYVGGVSLHLFFITRLDHKLFRLEADYGPYSSIRRVESQPRKGKNIFSSFTLKPSEYKGENPLGCSTAMPWSDYLAYAGSNTAQYPVLYPSPDHSKVSNRTTLGTFTHKSGETIVEVVTGQREGNCLIPPPAPKKPISPCLTVGAVLISYIYE